MFMKKIFLLILLLWSLFLPLQSQLRLQLLTQQEQLEVAQMLGKTVFAEDKLQVYDLHDNLIFEAELCNDVAMIIDAENKNVTLKLCDTTEIKYGVDDSTAVENIFVYEDIPVGSIIRVYTTNGALIKQTIFSEQTPLLIDYLPAGTYIMQINNTIFKVLK